MTAEEADSLTLPPVAVVRMRTIAGRVVNTAGRPVAGARVLNWGNPAPLSDAVTGPSGRFQLEGFPRERAWLFVDAPGFRFHRATPEPGKSTAELIIRRDDQPPERGIASLGPPVPRERALELAEDHPQAVRRSDHQARDRSRGPVPGPRRGGGDRPGRRLAEVPGRGGALGQQPGADRGRPPPRRQSAPTTPRRSSPRSRTTSGASSVRIELIDALPPAARDRKLALLDEAVRRGARERPTSA